MYYNAPREDVHPENNAKDARNNALLRLFVLVFPFNKKSGMVLLLLLLLLFQSTNQRRGQFFVWGKRLENSSLVFKRREGGVKANVREKWRRAFFQREKETWRWSCCCCCSLLVFGKNICKWLTTIYTRFVVSFYRLFSIQTLQRANDRETSSWFNCAFAAPFLKLLFPRPPS